MHEASSAVDYRDPDWVAEKLGLDKNTVYRFLQDGTIPAVQLGRRWLISEVRLGQWLRAESDRQTKARREAARSAERVVRRLSDFTLGARLAIKHAHSEARRYGHTCLGQGHLLLGILSDAASQAAQVLNATGLDLKTARGAIEQRMGCGSGPVARRLGRDGDAKHAMRIAQKLAERDASASALVSTDHLLRGMLLSRRGLGYEMLRGCGITLSRLRAASMSGGQPIQRGRTHEC